MLAAVIGGFRSDMSIARMIDVNFGKRFRECFVFQSRVSTKTVVKDTRGDGWGEKSLSITLYISTLRFSPRAVPRAI